MIDIFVMFKFENESEITITDISITSVNPQQNPQKFLTLGVDTKKLFIEQCLMR